MQQPIPAAGWKDLAFADVAQELEATRRILERIPEDRLDWRPHRRSWTLGELAAHVANLPHWFVMTVQTDGLDLAAAPGTLDPPDRKEKLLALFDDHARALREALESIDEGELLKPWTLRRGTEVLLEQPKAVVVRRTSISHLIHHRAQLTVYLRLLDTPVPSTFGPTADEGTSPPGVE